jgi:hypothetical protein
MAAVPWQATAVGWQWQLAVVVRELERQLATAVRLGVATREPDLIERVKLFANDERLATELAGDEPGRADGLRRVAVQSLKEAGFELRQGCVGVTVDWYELGGAQRWRGTCGSALWRSACC